MHINVIRTLPQQVYVAISGGVDSVVLAHKALSQNKDVTLAFYHHGNSLADKEEEFVTKFASDLGVPLEIGRCREKQIGSKEQFWRNSRYEFFRKLKGTVATGHNLDDAVEWYIMTCLRGEGHYMEYRNMNVIRPFILVPKASIVEYAKKHSLCWFDDYTNNDVEFTHRNKVRHSILPVALEINPGLYTTVSNNLRRRIYE